jgi:hypothetical protein
MPRSIAWIENNSPRWVCSECGWNYPLPALLEDPEARRAFDRLAQARFDQHKCIDYPRVGSSTPGHEAFSDRARKFIAHGYKPKDAVQLVLDEITLEYRHQPSVIEKARVDAEEFLRDLRQGKI